MCAGFEGGVHARIYFGMMGWKGEGGLPKSCRFCRVFCASCLRLIGLLGLNTEWDSACSHLGVCFVCLCCVSFVIGHQYCNSTRILF